MTEWMASSKLKDRKAEDESVANVKGRNTRICNNVPSLTDRGNCIRELREKLSRSKRTWLCAGKH